jgi:nanoRNase/pAp phosphatase (c-di-AMP/oligoRNAs hydrolase)
MDSAKQELIEKLKSSSNVLVTVSRNPSVDQLSALLGLGLILNKQGKHAAAVFSGNIPSTIQFLKPEDTFEKNTDSLRDFIIALDKSKADKLRYKVEDNIVRIFITPYKTSITQNDLDFSQGDFNVDLVIALGVKNQADLDDAITAHGRILHDATVASINTNNGGELGSINWRDQGASSLSELVTDLSQSIGDNVLDQQIATALLTGVVSETNRFSNDKTSSQTMTMSAVLMAAGANQQLVATKLEEPQAVRQVSNNESVDNQGDSQHKTDEPEDAVVGSDGTLEIKHQPGESPDHHEDKPEEEHDDKIESVELPVPAPEVEEPQFVEEPEQPNLDVQPPAGNQPTIGLTSTSKMVTEPPLLGGTLTANSQEEALDPVTDPFSMPQEEQPQLLDRQNSSVNPTPPPATPFQPLSPPSFPEPPSLPNFDNAANILDTPPVDQIIQPQPNPTVVTPTLPQDSPWANLTAPTQPVSTSIDQPGVSSSSHLDQNGTLSQLEQAVNSPHLNQADQYQVETAPSVDSAREEINQALNSSTADSPPTPIEALNAQPLGPSLHQNDVSPLPSSVPNEVVPPPFTPDSNTPAPPPVPPPIPFEFGNPSN